MTNHNRKRANLIKRLRDALFAKEERAPLPLPGLREDVVLNLVHVLLTGPAAPRTQLIDHVSRVNYLAEALNLSFDQALYLVENYEDAVSKKPFNLPDYEAPMRRRIPAPSYSSSAEAVGDRLH